MSRKSAQILLATGMWVQSWYSFMLHAQDVQYSPFANQCRALVNLLDDPKIESHVTYINKGYCNHALNLIIKVKNRGAESIRKIEYRIILNQKDSSQHSWEGLLAVGQTAEILVDDLILPPGVSNLKVRWVRINGATKIDDLSMSQSDFTFYTVAPEPFAQELYQGFEVSRSGETPPNLMIDNPYNARIFTVTDDVSRVPKPAPLGGFGRSRSSMRFDFFDIPEGIPGAVVFDKIDLRNRKHSTLSYSRAYAQRSAEEDRLIVEVSSDCGLSWTVVQNISGAALATTENKHPRRFYPDAHEWKRETFDLSGCDGKPEILVRFRGISGRGNALYIDDVELRSSPISTTQDEGNPAPWDVFPIPFNQRVTVQSRQETEQPAYFYLTALNGSDRFFLYDVRTNHNGTSWTIELPECLPAGVYYLQCSPNTINFKKKIIKL